MADFTVQYDDTNHAVYLHIGDASKPKRVEASVRVHSGIIVDVDKDGVLLGIEVTLPNTAKPNSKLSPGAELRLPTAAETARVTS